MREKSFSGYNALVTGGNKGIGKAIALRLAELGIKVAICGRNEKILKSTVNELNKLTPGCFYEIVDVRLEEDQKKLFKKIKDNFKKLDICIPNAGEATLATASKTSLKNWNRDIETNLTGLFLTCKMALKMMMKNKFGYIFPIISKAGKTAFQTRAAYCASKWGALGFTKAMALEAEKNNIRVTAICPASVDTDFQKGNPYGTDWMLKADDIADTVEYLLRASDKVKIQEILIETRHVKK